MRPAVCAVACAFGCLSLGVGCALFAPSDGPAKVETSRPVLPPLRPAADAVQLQVLFVDRPADDPLVTHQLWQEVDQVGAAAPALRTVLHDNGLRVAQSGASLPPALQTLLGMKGETVPTGLTDSSTNMGRQISLRSGQDSEILVNETLPACQVRYRFSSGEDTVDFPPARCVLRVRPTRLQDGWVKLEFTPEVHYGDSLMRHTPTEEGWALRGGQKIEVRHALKFQLTLNSGEMAVVGLAAGEPDTLGQRFFQSEQDGRAQQRLLVVRLADAGRTESTSRTDP
jgi:hypothetical protein